MNKNWPSVKQKLFGNIVTKEDALGVIRETSKGFYFFAALQGILGFMLIGMAALVDAALYAGLAFLLAKFRSRVAAVLLLLMSGVSLFTTLDTRINGGVGGQNLILAVVVIWISIRAVQATFTFHRIEASVEG